MRGIHEYLKPSWWVIPNSIYYGIFFPHWNGAFEWKPSVLLSLFCPADHSTACVKNTAFTWARHGQAVVSAASSKHGWYLHQTVSSQALGKKPVHFLTASMYNLHVQLFGGFWSRPSHARTDFAPVESRTKLYSTLTEAEASCESPVTHSFS